VGQWDFSQIEISCFMDEIVKALRSWRAIVPCMILAVMIVTLGYSVAAASPRVWGLTPTKDTTPTWYWRSGGDGNGTFRFKLDDEDLSSGATLTTATSYTPEEALGEGWHTLYVQEQDDTGGWSTSGSFNIVIDLGIADPPVISGISPTRYRTPTWLWSSNNESCTYRYKLNDPDLTSWAILTTQPFYSPPNSLAEGAHTL
jgi:hypothetical protein